MPEQPLTCESILEIIRESNREFQEFHRKAQQESQESRREFQESRRKAQREFQKYRQEAQREFQESRQRIQEIEQMLQETIRERKEREEREAEYARRKQEQEAEYARQKQERDAEYERMRQEAACEKQQRDAEYAQLKQKRDADYAQLKQETERQMKETDKKISALGSRIGEIVENMVSGNIVDKFQVFGYEIVQCNRRATFSYKNLGIHGEIDLLLEDGDIAILIEVKTSLETADVRRHIERLEKYRRCADAKVDTRRFVGAVAGAVVEAEARNFAHENGMYVIVQSGEAVEILPVPENFQAKEW